MKKEKAGLRQRENCKAGLINLSLARNLCFFFVQSPDLWDASKRVIVEEATRAAEADPEGP